MLLDANVLMFSVDTESPHRQPAKDWLLGALGGHVRLAIPWQTVGTSLRPATHPRVLASPLTGPQAWLSIQDWMDHPLTWVPSADERTVAILGRLLARHHVRGNLVPGAQPAALAIQHGIPVVSADSDFARFPEVRWVNPLG